MSIGGRDSDIDQGTAADSIPMSPKSDQPRDPDASEPGHGRSEPQGSEDAAYASPPENVRVPYFPRVRGWLGLPVFAAEDQDAFTWRSYERKLGLRRVYLNDLTNLRDLLKRHGDVVEVWNGWPRERQNHIETPPDLSDSLTQVRRWAILHARTDDWVLTVTLRFSQAQVTVNSRTSEGYAVLEEVVAFFDSLPDKTGDRLSRLGEPLVKSSVGASFLVAWLGSGRTLHWAPGHLFSSSLGVGDLMTIVAAWWIIAGVGQVGLRIWLGSSIIVPYPRPVSPSERPTTSMAPSADNKSHGATRIPVAIVLAGKGLVAVSLGVIGNFVYAWLR